MPVRVLANLGGLVPVCGAEAEFMLAKRIGQIASGFCKEIRGAFRCAANGTTVFRLLLDAVARRAIGRVRVPMFNRERQVRFKGSTRLCYRLNRGDLQSIREVWYEEAYRLPFDFDLRILVDLGANIGLTSVWLWKRYRCARVVAIEPSTQNARIARLNFELNGLVGEVIEAAIGPRDGESLFEDSDDSNVGHVGSGSRVVRVMSMDTLFSRLPEDSVVDLVKMDIEGGEQPLLEGDISWLSRVRALIVEFHPSVVDYGELVGILQRAGFRYFPAGSVFPGNMDCFLRQQSS